MDLISPVLTVGIGWISLGVGWKVVKRRLFSQIAQFANEYVASLMQDAIDHPEKLKPFLDLAIKEGFKSIGLDKPPNFDVKIGRAKIGGGIVQALLPTLQGAIQKGLANQVEEKVAEVAGFH